MEFALRGTVSTGFRAPRVQLVPGTTTFQLVNGGNVLDAPLTFSPYGINGGYYCGRINVKF
jgi:iron complex outermembrane recepter protein